MKQRPDFVGVALWMVSGLLGTWIALLLTAFVVSRFTSRDLAWALVEFGLVQFINPLVFALVFALVLRGTTTSSERWRLWLGYFFGWIPGTIAWCVDEKVSVGPAPWHLDEITKALIFLGPGVGFLLAALAIAKRRGQSKQSILRRQETRSLAPLLADRRG